MRDDERRVEEAEDALHPSTSTAEDKGPDSGEDDGKDAGAFDESLTDEIAALIDDGRTYVEAEIAFQKTRAKLAGSNVGRAVGLVLVALIMLHIAVLALAVGLVMALEPLVTIWGAIAIVVGVLLLATVLLLLRAVGHGKSLGAMFGSSDEDGAA